MDEKPEGDEIIDYKLSYHSPLPRNPLQLHVYQLGFHAKTGEEVKKLSFYYLRSLQKLCIEADTLYAAKARVRALCRDIRREQEFRPNEGTWCAGCDLQEFCLPKAKNPRPASRGIDQGSLGLPFKEQRRYAKRRFRFIVMLARQRKSKVRK